MKLIDRYVFKVVVMSVGFMMLLLGALFAFILFVDQLSDLGKGQYDAMHAIQYVLYSMPEQLYLSFPMASLMGTLMGLGILAQHRELLIFRAAGCSLLQLTGIVFKAALFLMLIATSLGEIVVPHMTRLGKDLKFSALSSGQTLRTVTGVWVRDQHDFFKLGRVDGQEEVRDVVQFHFDASNRLSWVRAIARIARESSGWVAYDGKETHFELRDKTYTTFWSKKPFSWQFSPLWLAQQYTPDEMSVVELYRYLSQHDKKTSNLGLYRLAYVARIVQPFTILVMIALAIPFIFGPLRSSTMGAKLLMGVSVGFSFYLFNRFMGPLSLVLQWPPELAAILPTLCFAILGLWLIRHP